MSQRRGSSSSAHFENHPKILSILLFSVVIFLSGLALYLSYDIVYFNSHGHHMEIFNSSGLKTQEGNISIISQSSENISSSNVEILSDHGHENASSQKLVDNSNGKINWTESSDDSGPLIFVVINGSSKAASEPNVANAVVDVGTNISKKPQLPRVLGNDIAFNGILSTVNSIISKKISISFDSFQRGINNSSAFINMNKGNISNLKIDVNKAEKNENQTKYAGNVSSNVSSNRMDAGIKRTPTSNLSADNNYTNIQSNDTLQDNSSLNNELLNKNLSDAQNPKQSEDKNGQVNHQEISIPVKSRSSSSSRFDDMIKESLQSAEVDHRSGGLKQTQVGDENRFTQDIKKPISSNSLDNMMKEDMNRVATKSS